MAEKEQNTFKKLQWFRYEFSDKIPSEIIHSWEPGKSEEPPKLKVRKNWFTGVVASLKNAITEELIKSPALIQEVDSFLEHYTGEEFRDQPKVTAEDIERANLLIDKVLGKTTDVVQ